MDQLVVIPLEALRSMLEEVIHSQPSRINVEPESQILDVEKAAEFLSISTSSLYSFTSKRKIPHFKRGKKLYFKKDDLLAWVAEGKKDSVSEILKRK